MENQFEVYVRFANDCTYYNKINLDPTKIKDPQIFQDEVFCTVDNLRIAIPRLEWDKIMNEKKIWYEKL